MKSYTITCTCNLCRNAQMQYEQFQTLDHELVQDWLVSDGWLVEGSREFCPDCKTIKEEQQSRDAAEDTAYESSLEV